MPSYFYHLRFELYPNPNPDVNTSLEANDIWLPPAGASIFDSLPLPSSHSISDQRIEYTILPSNKLDPGISGTTSTVKPSNASVIDCGTRAPARGKEKTIEIISERQWLERSKSFPPPPSSAGIGPKTAVQDWRFDRVSVESVDLGYSNNMPGEGSKQGSAAPTLGPNFGGAGTSTKAVCVTLESKRTQLGWGVVHFYREGEETPALNHFDEKEDDAGTEESKLDCTTLCIPSVPGYMSPGDFLGFMGDRWGSDISHCRMVKTSRLNRYLVLLKFRDGKRAKEYRQEFEGKVFNTMDEQLCHIVFVKSIEFETPNSSTRKEIPAGTSSMTISNSLKPFPPPTPDLVELPTCPVCLERMDETNGLMTIPCSHVFHCNCLQTWKGAGCPVCRFTNTAHDESADPNNPFTQPFGSSVSNLCTVCDCPDDLWICLICGYVGCGRYKGGHAKEHWKQTAHSFSLELLTQHVWDYAGDTWVHRLIRDKGDGKVVELPGRSDQERLGGDEDVVPRAKLETIGLEYMHLLTSQLDSQRAYYEEMMSKAVDKASQASKTAEEASKDSSTALQRLAELEGKHRALSLETVPQLERDLEREANKASKGQNLARSLGNALQEEKRLNEGLMKRIEHLGADSEAIRKQLEQLKLENEELKETNRDLSMFISGQEKLKEMESEGQIQEGDLEGSSAIVPEKKGKRRGKR